MPETGVYYVPRLSGGISNKSRKRTVTLEQRAVMERMVKGEHLTSQLGGLSFEAAWFGDQTSVERNVFQSLIDAEWIVEAEQQGTTTDYAVTALGKTAYDVEVIYMFGLQEIATAKLCDVIIAVQMYCYIAIHESEKHTHFSEESDIVFAREILKLTNSGS